jgi:hypothetical protein
MKKIVAVAMTLVGALTLTGCGEEPTPVPDVVGLRLDKAKDMLDGVWVREIDYLGEGRVIRDKNWTVCTQSVAPGGMASSIVLEVAKEVSDCPDQRTPEERAIDSAKAEQEANEKDELETYYAELQTRLTPNTAVLKPGEWVTLDQCEVRLADDPELMVTTFEETYEDMSWLTNSQWAIKDLGDYLYVYFEAKPGCGHFAPSAVLLERGYDKFWGREHSVAWGNTYVPQNGGEGALVIYKVKDGATKFKLGLSYGAGPSYEFSAR